MENWSSRLGVMQGRLSPLIGDKIQAFPFETWREEFSKLREIRIPNLEWTLDHHNLNENPFMTDQGRQEIRALCTQHSVRIVAVTCDNFMQKPFFKQLSKAAQETQLDQMKQVLEACSLLKVGICVIPVVDQSSINSTCERDSFLEGLEKLLKHAPEENFKLSIESDWTPDNLKKMLDCLNTAKVGINYDIGNSASLGFDPKEEFKAYGDKVIHVHIKDRLKGGSTVPLGQGSANFETVFELLRDHDYRGYGVFQTARAPDDDHVGALLRYKEFVKRYLK